MALPIDSNGNVKTASQGTNPVSGTVTTNQGVGGGTNWGVSGTVNANIQVAGTALGVDNTNELKVSLYAKKTTAGDTVLTTDTSGNLAMTLLGLIAGEDQTLNRLAIENNDTYSNVTASGSTVVKSGAGILSKLTINTKSGATGILVLYDNTAASGTKIATIDVTGGPLTLLYGVAFATGLTASFTGTLGSFDVTISYL